MSVIPLRRFFRVAIATMFPLDRSATRRFRQGLDIMAAAYGEIGIAAAASRGHGVVRRAVARMNHVRERQMPRYVNGYQLALDDASLATFGFDRETFERAAFSAPL
jgi:hypothetical protein